MYSINLHPTLDLLFTGGRDSVCRVWDIRTKLQVHCLSGHDNTVASILTQPTDPQVRTYEVTTAVLYESYFLGNLEGISTEAIFIPTELTWFCFVLGSVHLY